MFDTVVTLVYNYEIPIAKNYAAEKTKITEITHFFDTAYDFPMNLIGALYNTLTNSNFSY